MPGPLHFRHVHSQPSALQQAENEHSLNETVMKRPSTQYVRTDTLRMRCFISKKTSGLILLNGAEAEIAAFCALARRCFRRHSRAALNRQQELSHLPMPPQLRLYDYLQRRKERKPPAVDLKISKIGNVSRRRCLLWRACGSV